MPQHAPTVDPLSVAEKASLTSGSSTWRSTAAGDLVSLVLSDGPHGVRRQPQGGDNLGIGSSIPATCFPPAVALGCSWDEDLARRVGEALGREARALGVDVLLGPGMNIKRSPLGGRSFEYLSEDPHLTGRLAAALVEGLQSQGVAACVKHFAVNNQETDRMRVSAEVDERALREVYLAAFEHVVRTARPWSLMSAYNRVNGVPASENPWLLTEVLREEWGFDGVVVSDWGAVEDRVAAVAAGNDLEMPPSGSDDRVVAAVAEGRLEETVLDGVVDRLRRLQSRVLPGRAAEPLEAIPAAMADAHHALAREAATASIVLLRNDDAILPLSRERRVALIGELARTPRFQGGGSSRVVPTRTTSLLGSLGDRLGDRLSFAPGYALAGGEGGDDDVLRSEALACAKDSDVVVLALGLPEPAESEGFDRTDLDLPAEQRALVSALGEAGCAVVIVLLHGGVVTVSEWEHHARALLDATLPGQAGGEAIADMLLGDASPAGRLAETIPVRLLDHPSAPTFPGSDGISVYGESVDVGYRGLDLRGTPVSYPFGHGLSYTTVDYADLTVVPDGDGWVVEATVTNTGGRAGAEVAQLYVGRDDPGSRGAAVLRGFVKVTLAPGESERVRFALRPRDLARWDVRERRWSLAAGRYAVAVGASSRDIRLSGHLDTVGDGHRPRLTRMSTIAEWRDDPDGAAVLGVLLGRLRAAGESGAVAPELIRMVEQTPIVKLRTFGLGLTEDVVDAMVGEVDRRRAQQTHDTKEPA